MKKLSKLKQDFIDGASLILEHRLALATGGASGESKLDITQCQQDLHDGILADLMEVVKCSDLPIKANWKNKDNSGKVDRVLRMIGSGKITPSEGKHLIESIVIGLDVELEGMLARVEELEQGGKR